MGIARARIKDVADLAGVSVGTVSNVLNHPKRVSPVTRQQVTDAVEKLGFVRNESARQLRTGNSGMIGLVVLDISNPFFSDVATSAEQVITDAGYSLMLANSGEDRAREARHLQLFERTRAEGLLVSSVGGAGMELARLRERGVPVVTIDSGVGHPDACAVSVNDIAGGRLAIEHLLNLGHQRIAVVGGPGTLRQVTERLTGAHQAVAERADGDGKGARLDVIATDALSVAEGRRVGSKLANFVRTNRPTAIFALNDLLALGLLQSFTLSQIRVPEDIALIGYDDIDFAAAVTIPLTSIRQPRHDIGRLAAELLLEEVQPQAGAEPHVHQHITFTPELIVRASTHGQR